jgi:hypothetical protein
LGPTFSKAGNLTSTYRHRLQSPSSMLTPAVTWQTQAPPSGISNFVSGISIITELPIKPCLDYTQLHGSVKHTHVLAISALKAISYRPVTSGRNACVNQTQAGH